MDVTAEIGTQLWISQVRGTPPVREPLGRSRPTHQFAPYCRHLNLTVGIEGGNELTALLMLDVFALAGLVTWFKPQPFELTEQAHGINAVPDFAFQWRSTGQIYIAEAKAKAYINESVLAETSQLSKLFAAHGVEYLLWNDKEHLTRMLGSNVRKLWNCRSIFLSDEEIKAARDSVASGARTLGQLISQGVKSDAIFHLADAGHLHFNLMDKRSLKTNIAGVANEQHYDALLKGRIDPESWWNAIPDKGA